MTSSLVPILRCYIMEYMDQNVFLGRQYEERAILCRSYAPKRMVWAVDPDNGGLIPNSTSLRILKTYLKDVKEIYPVYIASDRNVPHVQESRLEQLQEIIQQTLPSSQVTTEVVSCHHCQLQKKVQELLLFSKQKGAEGVLVSSHGRSGFNRVALGSFAETLLEEAPIPLWFLPRNEIQECNLHRVLFATDFTEHSKQGFLEFLKWVEGIADELVLFHAVSYPIEGLSACAAAGVPGPPPTRAVQSQISWAQRQAQGWIQNAKESGVSVHLHSVIREVFPTAGRSVLEIASRQKIALIGVASQSGPWSRTLFGSVAFEICRAQSHSVWVCGTHFYS